MMGKVLGAVVGVSRGITYSYPIFALARAFDDVLAASASRWRRMVSSPCLSLSSARPAFEPDPDPEEDEPVDGRSQFATQPLGPTSGTWAVTAKGDAKAETVTTARKHRSEY